MTGPSDPTRRDERTPEETSTLAHPERIGPFRILQVLGEGGMGVVYAAEQTEPVRRRVALKVIKLGMDSKEQLARFEVERQALAVMDHPAITRVIDVGTTASAGMQGLAENGDVPGLVAELQADGRVDGITVADAAGPVLPGGEITVEITSTRRHRRPSRSNGRTPDLGHRQE